MTDTRERMDHPLTLIPTSASPRPTATRLAYAIARRDGSYTVALSDGTMVAGVAHDRDAALAAVSRVLRDRGKAA